MAAVAYARKRDRELAWRILDGEPTRLDRLDRAAQATFDAFDRHHQG